MRELKYQSLKQTLTFATEVSVSLVAMATNGNEHYDRVYNAGEQKTGPLLPDEKERAETVNKVVGDGARRHAQRQQARGTAGAVRRGADARLR